jgi:cobalt-zinc-cadmium efflux system outer membrane protein
MKQRHFYMAVILLAGARLALAQTNSLDRVVRDALEGNPELLAAASELAAARGERRAAGQWKNPELSVEYGEKRVRDGMGDLTGKGNSQSYALAQTFEFPGKASLRKAIADRNIELAQLAFEQLRREVAARARLLGVEWAAADQEALAAREVADRSATLVAMLGRRVPAGAQSALDQRIIQASMVDIETRAREAEERRDNAGIALNVLRGRPAREPLQLAVPLVPPPGAAPWESLWAGAQRSNFTLRSRNVELDRAGRALAQARLDAAPDLTIGPFFSKENAIRDESEKVLGISASLPLPLWDSGRGRTDAARARVSLSDAARSQAFREVEQELARAHASCLATRRQLDRYPVSDLKHLRDGADLADRQYRLGAVQVQTYLDMQDQYLSALSGTLGTLREAHERFLRIQTLTGDASLLPMSTTNPRP